MKKTILLLSALLAGFTAFAADDSTRQADIRLSDSSDSKMVSNLKVERNDNMLHISADISLAGQPAGSNRELWLQPVISSGDSAVNLPAVAVAGKNRYIQGLRHGTALTPGLSWTERKAADSSISYSATIPYSKWMDRSTLSIDVTVKGCCGVNQQTAAVPVAAVSFATNSITFTPAYNWITPAREEVKTRELRGQAYIDFPVRQTDIVPDYRSNAQEIARIRATIDSVRTDSDVTIHSISIHGYASPEGAYDLNESLARGRTEALKNYVEKLYNFAPGIITTACTAENWEGLRQWLDNNTLTDGDAILAIMNRQDLTPDAREWKIKSEYPVAYAYLKENVYPSLRRSDYRIEYTVRDFTDTDEIIRMAATHPQHLSLAEFFNAAHSVPQGSDIYNNLYETAARMFPGSEIANLNAANAAMQRGDLTGAAAYLAKAGDGPEAIYARGNLEALRGNYTAANDLFRQAARLKVADAPAAINQITKIENN